MVGMVKGKSIVLILEEEEVPMRRRSNCSKERKGPGCRTL